MDRERLKEVLADIGVDAGKNGVYKDSGDNIQFCCPFHGETRPSCGINIFTEAGYCFACDTGFNLTKLVAHCLDVPIYKAIVYLEDKFGWDMKEVQSTGIMRIDDEEEKDPNKRFELPRVYIAPFKSGKATHDYFFERGFTKETVKKFMVGWDAKRMRITVPVFWEDGAVCGVIGRAVLEMRNKNGEPNKEFFKVYKASEYNDTKYHIYEKFPVGDILFPLQHFKPKNKTAILVEGQYDCMWMHQLEHCNTFSSLGSKLKFNKRTKESKQIEILKSYDIDTVILMKDDDEAGEKGAKHDFDLLKNDFRVLTVKYPKGKTDPQQLTKKEADKMIKEAKPYGVKKIKRIK